MDYEKTRKSIERTIDNLGIDVLLEMITDVCYLKSEKLEKLKQIRDAERWHNLAKKITEIGVGDYV